MEKFDFKKVFRKDYSKINEFDRIGIHYTKIAESDEYVAWLMDGVNYAVEVWKKRWRKQPDGTLYLAPPSDEKFGENGWYFVGKEDFVKSQVRDRFGIALN